MVDSAQIQNKIKQNHSSLFSIHNSGLFGDASQSLEVDRNTPKAVNAPITAVMPKATVGTGDVIPAACKSKNPNNIRLRPPFSNHGLHYCQGAFTHNHPFGVSG